MGPDAEKWYMLVCVRRRQVGTMEKAEFKRLGCTEQTKGGDLKTL